MNPQTKEIAMVVMIEKRKIELRIRGSHGPPCAEELARSILRACCDEPPRPSNHASVDTDCMLAEVKTSQQMAEVTITKYGPHG